MPSSTPLVSVLLAVRDGEEFVGQAVASILLQSLADLELVVVDDGSVDTTPAILDAIGDPRLVVVRNESALGLATALNVGMERARGRYLARIDADDVALPRRLERQVALLERTPGLAVVGSSAIEFGAGRPLILHRMPVTDAEVRWAALFSAPFLHPSVTVDRAILEDNGLLYDAAYRESEDYDLWTRLLRVGAGMNLLAPQLLYRRHAAQASAQRSELQRSFQRRVALRQIRETAPDLDEDRATLAWALGSGQPVPDDRLDDAVDALSGLVAAFGAAGDERRRVARREAALALARASTKRPPAARAGLIARAVALDPDVPLHAAGQRVRRLVADRRARGEAQQCLRRTARVADGGPVRVTVVSPEPTPYRSRLFDLIAARADVELGVIYAGSSLQGRTWTVATQHHAVVLEGRSLPGAAAILRHDYPISTGVLRALRALRPDVCVIAGWSTFASQAAIVWCRRHGVPYVLHVESNDHDRRSGWRRRVKSVVADPVVAGAAHVLVVGSLARESVVARGADPARVSVFANTIDVEEFGSAAERLAPQRETLRAELGLGRDDVAILCVARLSLEKALDTLVRAVAAADDPRLVLVLVGGGPERERLVELARSHGVRLVLPGDIPWSRIVERYVAADVFALVSTHEPWGVVVNEAAACGLSLVLSDRVGAAADLLVDGENGVLVPAGDVAAVTRAIGALADDPGFRAAAGAASRRIVSTWGYGPSVDAFVAAVRAASSR